MDIRNMQEFNNLKNIIPVEVYEDVSKRISDWVESGGDIKANYVKRQFKYVEMVLDIKGV